MTTNLKGRRVAILATSGVEQSELTVPWQALERAGAAVELVSLKGGNIQAEKHDEKADTFAVAKTLDEAAAGDYDALVLPGGVKNPDRLRMDPRAVRFVRAFVDEGKPIAAICHGPWTLVEAGGVKGRTLTSWPSLKTDIRNAGGEWVDEMVHVDQKLVTSRKPDDLPAFCEKMVSAFGADADEASVDLASEQSFPASDPPPGPSSIGHVEREGERR